MNLHVPPPAPRTTPRILAIDDEPQLRRFLDISLRAQGYDVELAETAEAGLASLALSGADLVILDMSLPDRHGLEVLRELRHWSAVPVIMLTVTADEMQKVAALDLGANDYVTKPFGVQELLARIRALLRNATTAQAPAAVFDDGSLRVDRVQRTVTVDGQPVPLSRKEYALLTLLLDHAGRVVTQPQLMRALWGPTYEQETHYLRILVGKLRRKLGDNAASPRWIATEPGIGLRFLEHRNTVTS